MRLTSSLGDNAVTVAHPEKNKAFTSEHRPTSSCHFPPLIQFASGNLIGRTRKTAHLQKLQSLAGNNYVSGWIYECSDALWTPSAEWMRPGFSRLSGSTLLTPVLNAIIARVGKAHETQMISYKNLSLSILNLQYPHGKSPLSTCQAARKTAGEINSSQHERISFKIRNHPFQTWRIHNTHTHSTKGIK